MKINLHEFTGKENPWQPAFLEQRMDAFYQKRWAEQWHGEHILRGRQPGKNSVRLFSNDYLGIANHPRIVDAQVEALRGGEESVLMSGIFLHGENPQAALEKRLAEYVGMPAAILSQSGYAANVGLLQAIASEGVPVYIDMIAHASLWEGIHSAGATARPFRHNDLADLEKQMAAHGPGVLCVDSIYSTIGSICPLQEMVALARSYGSLIIVDESHSFGLLGESGAGLVHQLGLADEVDFITVSLAKAFAGRAGAIFCRQDFVDYFWFTARPAIFSSCLLPHELAGLDATLELIRNDHWRRATLFENAGILRTGLAQLGYNVSASQSQIIGIESGDEYTTLLFRKALEEQDIFGSVFCAPATSARRALVRLSVNASLSLAELERALGGFAAVRDQVGMWNWASTRRRHSAGERVAV